MNKLKPERNRNRIPDGTQRIVSARPGSVPNTAIHSNTDVRKWNFDYASRFGMNIRQHLGNFLRRS